MSETAPDTGGFNPLLIAGIVIVGVIAFIALWALIALGPQLSSGNDGGGHALSKAAPGYAGIVDMLERSGAGVELRRREGKNVYTGEETLLILTPTHRTKPDELAALIDGAAGGHVLIVLPKWQTMRLPGQSVKPGWAGIGVPVPPRAEMLPERLFGKVSVETTRAKAQPVPVDLAGRPFAAYLPDNAQTVDGSRLEPLIAGANAKGAVLARVGDGRIYILADPDLINNLAFASRDKAEAAAMLIDAVGEDADADALAFDLTLNGFGSQRSLLRFAFVPPFIGITLCLIAAGLLALWQAWMRFGPALKPQRAIPISKAALIANSADLIKQARRELDGADAYVHSQRLAIARRLHVPSGLDTAATDAWIDKRLKGGNLFSSLARRLPLARNKHEFLSDAQALHDIRKELLRDG